MALCDSETAKARRYGPFRDTFDSKRDGSCLRRTRVGRSVLALGGQEKKHPLSLRYPRAIYNAYPRRIEVPAVIAAPDTF